jgi:16S rRNA (cytosine1402-N4)-methyltransferase
MTSQHTHQPVLLSEAIEGLNIKPNGIYIDTTFGRGGHSLAILEKLNKKGKLIAIDKDNTAVKEAKKIKDKRFTIYQGSFIGIKKITDIEGCTGNVDGILMDLGVSSPQLDDASRGFSFRKEGPLDMRMDTTEGKPLSEYLEKMTEKKLEEIIKTYGEEKFARRISKAIVEASKIEKITTTIQLANIIAKAHPSWKKDKHPATQTFQALRIFMNNELTDIHTTLPICLEVLKVGGRLIVISFHSLEDRMMKKFIQQEVHGSKSKNLLKVPLRHKELSVKLQCVGRAIRPSTNEISYNPRAKSAILRIVEKIK